MYQRYKSRWLKLFDVFHGSNGFMSGDYLIAHPREYKDHDAVNPKVPTKALTARKALAQYANIAAPILEAKADAMFRSPITRTVGGKAKGDHPIESWWENVDGRDPGCSITDYMYDSFIMAGLYGHVVHYVDREIAPEGGYDTAADAPLPYLRTYNPLDVPDWLHDDRGLLTQIALLEGNDIRASLKEAYTFGGYRIIYLTDTGWEIWEGQKQKRGNAAPALISRGDHNMGLLPIVVQYATRRRMEPLIGESILGDPNAFVDIYNIDSEIRQVLRGQTFGILTITIGTGDQMVDLEKVKAMMGTEKGVDNVLFTPGGAEYIQPDSTNVTVYQDERKSRVREIYRRAAIPFESDTKSAEAEGSLKLKREDMEQVLSRYCQQCEKAEIALAKMFFRAYYGPEAWQTQWDNADVEIHYPTKFDMTPFAEVLEQAQAAMALEMPPEVMSEIRKSLIGEFLPNATPEEVKKLADIIDKAAKDAAKVGNVTHKATLLSIASGAHPDAPMPQPGVAA